MVLRESEYSHRAAEESLCGTPLPFCFLSRWGCYLTHYLIEQPVRVLAVVAVIMIGKSLAAIACGGAAVSHQRRLKVSASLAQIGEFSFILASLGISLGLLPWRANLILAGARFISITLKPLLFAAVKPLLNWLVTHNNGRVLEHPQDPLAAPPTCTADRYLRRGKLS